MCERDSAQAAGMSAPRKVAESAAAPHRHTSTVGLVGPRTRAQRPDRSAAQAARETLNSPRLRSSSARVQVRACGLLRIRLRQGARARRALRLGPSTCALKTSQKARIGSLLTSLVCCVVRVLAVLSNTHRHGFFPRHVVRAALVCCALLRPSVRRVVLN